MHLGVFARQRRQKRAGEEEREVNEAELTPLREVVGRTGGEGEHLRSAAEGPAGV